MNSLDRNLGAYTGGNVYDFDNEVMLTWYSRRIVDLCVGATSMLELGLGHGHTTELMARAFGRHVVLDGSPAVIDNFRSLHPDCTAEIREVYFEAFDTDERFDVIVMGFILEHVDDPVLVMRRFSSFLAPGGRIFVAVPNAESLNRRIGHAAGLLADMRALGPNDHLLGHQRYYTATSLAADIAEAGYDVVRLEGIYLKPLTTTQMMALDLSEPVIRAFCEVGIQYPELSCGMLAEIAPR